MALRVLNKVGVWVKDQTLVEVLATKPSNDHNAISCELCCAKSLPGQHLKGVALGVRDLDLTPGALHALDAQTDLKALNRV